MNNTTGFTSWKDESLALTLKWSSSEERDKGVQELLTAYPKLQAEKKAKNKVKLICENAAQVWFVKQRAEAMEAKVA